MPWRNGLGTTTELARQDHKVLPGFIWRVSRADVASSGPFSNFSGVDRILFLLSGNGFRLDFGTNTSETLTSRYQCARFPGDLPTDCQLIDGPCRDLNIMVSRAHATAAATLHETTANSIFAEPTILHALSGDWTMKIDGAKTPIAEDSLLIITSQSGMAFTIEGRGALLQADIRPII